MQFWRKTQLTKLVQLNKKHVLSLLIFFGDCQAACSKAHSNTISHCNLNYELTWNLNILCQNIVRYLLILQEKSVVRGKSESKGWNNEVFSVIFSFLSWMFTLLYSRALGKVYHCILYYLFQWKCVHAHLCVSECSTVCIALGQNTRTHDDYLKVFLAPYSDLSFLFLNGVR